MANFRDNLDNRTGHASEAKAMNQAVESRPKGQSKAAAVAAAGGDPHASIKTAAETFRNIVVAAIPDMPSKTAVITNFEEGLLDLMQQLASNL